MRSFDYVLRAATPAFAEVRTAPRLRQAHTRNAVRA